MKIIAIIMKSQILVYFSMLFFLLACQSSRVSVARDVIHRLPAYGTYVLIEGVGSDQDIEELNVTLLEIRNSECKLRVKGLTGERIVTLKIGEAVDTFLELGYLDPKNEVALFFPAMRTVFLLPSD
jgi:hypothetical protein